MTILDTNVISEAMLLTPNDQVQQWLSRQAGQPLFTTTVNLAEILYGIEILPTGKRRSGLLASANVLIAFIGLNAQAPNSPVQRIADSADIPAGGTLLFRYPTTDDPCILVRDRSGRLDAYSQVCTHLSCAVIHRPDEQALACPCHKGSFSSIDGKPLAGPPTRRLPRIVIEQRGTDIVATGIEV